MTIGSRTAAAALALTALTLAPGCGASSRDAAELTNTEQITQFIYSLEDVRGNPKHLAGWFATGAAPPAAELRKFAKYHDYRPSAKPTVSGETATVKVHLFDANSQQVGEVEWTFVQEGGHWKLKSAPLP
jgi:hypothetical protein